MHVWIAHISFHFTFWWTSS